MNDPGDTPVWRDGTGNGSPRRLWNYDDFTAVEEPPAADLAGELTSLGFISAALRRRVRVWGTLAAVGFLVGCGLYVKFPPPHQAAISVLLKDNPSEPPTVEESTDQALAQSSAVAGRVVQQLGLQKTPGAFLATYTVTTVSNQVFTFTVSAPSYSDAVSRASVLATDFLQARAAYLRSQLQQTMAELNQQMTQAQEHVNSLTGQIDQVAAQPSSPAQHAKLASLQQQRTDASNTLAQTEQYVTATVATAKMTTSSMVQDSEVVDAAVPVSHSHVKKAALDVAEGVFGGLALGLIIVIVSALASDRLRRRDDVAAALGAPVRLSVGTLRVKMLGLRGRAKRNLDTRRVVTHLRSVIPASSRGPAGLAVVAVDNAKAVAPVLVSLAVSCAQAGQQVVVADLSGGALAARLGVKASGVRAISVNGQTLVAVVPDRVDPGPVGPFRPRAQSAPPDQPLVEACASADLLLTLATLNPAFGGDHLATWATDTVVMVTAGQSSGVRVHGVGEMIRLAGMRLNSVVLIGADKDDESLGAAPVLDELAPVKQV